LNVDPGEQLLTVVPLDQVWITANFKASRDLKIRRLISKSATQDKAIELIDTTDKARAAFVRQYLGLEWPEPHLYHAMFNTEMGESCTATMLVECVQQFERDAE
jgi:hypothetical protein